MTPTIVETGTTSADDLAAVINRAYEIEKFFVLGDRTTPATVRLLMTKGAFLAGRDDTGAIVACVYVKMEHGRGYFGMLSVDPGAQGHGWGRRLIEAAEHRARRAGCTAMDIRVVNLRQELFPLYRRFDYAESGIEQADDPRAIRPFHFVVMSKTL